jgi:hypothetical protein
MGRMRVGRLQVMVTEFPIAQAAAARRDPCSEAINGTIDPLAVPVKGMDIEYRCAWKYCELILIA